MNGALDRLPGSGFETIAGSLGWRPDAGWQVSAAGGGLDGEQHGLFIAWQGDGPVPPALTPSRARALRMKRLLDIAGALLGLAFFAPLMFFVAIAIRLTDPGPVLFRQARLGLGGVPFQVLKFRSMYADRCDQAGIRQAEGADDRVTPIGRFIRRSSIDELPQLFNVLKGDMSLVGPRPHVSGMHAGGVPYGRLSPHYAYRTLMRPGLTGWAQCHGLRGPTHERAAALARLGHDIAYIQHFSLALDIRIVARTLFVELFRGNAH